MAQGIEERMEAIRVESKNKDLNDLLKSTESQTQAQLADVAQRADYLQDYMTLNAELAGKIDGFLAENQTYGEKFRTMLKNPKGGAWKRFVRATFGWVPVLGKKLDSSLSPKKVAEVIKDMYTNMVMQKDAVAKQLKIVKDRREDLFAASAKAVADQKQSAVDFENAMQAYQGIEGALSTARELMDANGIVGEVDLTPVSEYSAQLGYTADKKPQRINLIQLTELVDKLEQDFATADEERLKTETRLNASKSAIRGYRIQKDQFNAYVKTTAAMLYGLETHLDYSKEIVENQAILSQATDTAVKALHAFSEYQDAVNNTFVLNSIGVQLMAQETAEMLSRDTFDAAFLDEAEVRVKQADAYWNKFRDEYTAKADDLAKKIKASQQPTE